MGTAERVTAIVSYLAAADGERGLAEIGKEVGLSKSSVRRILSSLGNVQWVIRE